VGQYDVVNSTHNSRGPQVTQGNLPGSRAAGLLSP